MHVQKCEVILRADFPFSPFGMKCKAHGHELFVRHASSKQNSIRIKTLFQYLYTDCQSKIIKCECLLLDLNVDKTYCQLLHEIQNKCRLLLEHEKKFLYTANHMSNLVSDFEK